MSPFPPPPMPQPVAPHSPLQTIAKVSGGVFLTAGALGLVPGIGGEQFGLVGMSMLLTIVHLGFGVAGLLAGRTPTRAQSFLIVGGGLYLVLFLTGRVLGYALKRGDLVDGAGSWLQVTVAVVMITLGAVLSRTPRRDDTMELGRRKVPGRRAAAMSTPHTHPHGGVAQ